MNSDEEVGVWYGATGALRTLKGVKTIGDVRTKIEAILNVPSDEQILFSPNDNKLLLDDALVLDAQDPRIKMINLYKKVTTPQSVDIHIIRMETGGSRRITISSDQTVAFLRREIDRLYGTSPYPRPLFYFGNAMLNDDDQLCKYLLAPLPEENDQAIRFAQGGPTNPSVSRETDQAIKVQVINPSENMDIGS